MAITINQYNHTAKLLLNKEVDYTTLKVMLLNNSAPFDASHANVDDVAGAGPTRANEVFGNGWVQGGPTLTGVAITTTGTNDAKLDADDVQETASGGSIGPAYAALVYDSTTGNALWHIDFGQAQEAGDTTNFNIVWNAIGILQLIYA
jgi:hypothetical protein